MQSPQSSAVSVHYEPVFGPHPVRPRECMHPPTAAMSVNQRIVKDAIVLDAAVCMDCGEVTQGDMPLGHALVELWKRYGWNYRIGKRVCLLWKRWLREQLREGRLTYYDLGPAELCALLRIG